MLIIITLNITNKYKINKIKIEFMFLIHEINIYIRKCQYEHCKFYLSFLLSVIIIIT